MAGIKTERSFSRLQGYVLVESVFSMVVIMICFGIAMMIFSTVIGSSGNSLHTLARIRIRTEAQKCKTENRFIDEDISFEEYTIHLRIRPYAHTEHLHELELKAVTPEGKLLAEYHELIRR
jgi:uncharacterized membrane protein